MWKRREHRKRVRKIIWGSNPFSLGVLNGSQTLKHLFISCLIFVPQLAPIHKNRHYY